MPETQEAIRPILVKYTCDSCKVGEMRPTPEGAMLLNCGSTSHPVKFKHVCTHCCDEIILTEKYPTVRYIHEGENLAVGKT